MQIPTSAGMLANSVLPVTPTQGGLLPQTGETAGSTRFAPVEAVSTIRLSRAVPEQRPQPNFAPENSGQAQLTPPQNTTITKSGSAADADAGGIDEPQQAGQKISQDDASGNESQNNTARNDQAKHEAEQVQHRQEQQQQQDLDIIRQLSQRDNVVRAHEQAHSSVGGQHAGSAQYSYQRGPDGVSYAVGGEVPIDVGAIHGNPRATLEKMQLVQRAALAPADPSSQDRRVAALASQQANQARAEIVSESRVTGGGSDDTKSSDDKKDTQLNSKQVSEASNIRVSVPVSVDSEDFQVFNNRIAKINEVLLAISRNDVTNATGQLLDDVV
ncbi:MAG: putative metalloprotease CJM1_0395 family protein [Oleispira sp.]